MAPERVTLAAVAPTMKKLIDCLEALGMNPGTYFGGPDSVLVFGKRDDLRLAAQVRYSIGETPTGKPSAKFVSARVHDPVGIVENLEANYYYNKAEIKQQGLLPDYAEKLGQERSARYNDGAQYRKMIADFHTAGEVNEWLDDWLETLSIDHKRQSAKKKERPTEADLLKGAEWTA